jgi:hypothetical protein
VASWIFYRYVAPKSWREWTRPGIVQAFIIAFYAEMYGFRVTVYLNPRNSSPSVDAGLDGDEFGVVSASPTINSIHNTCTYNVKCSSDSPISVLVETDVKTLKKDKAEVGIDVRIKTLATTRDGEKIENPRPLIKHEKRLRILQRRLSRKVKDSNNRARARFRSGATARRNQ